MRHRLVSPGAERFLPFAESCITKLLKLGLPYADQSFEVDGCSIKVRIEPGHEYIRIDGPPGIEMDSGVVDMGNMGTENPARFAPGVLYATDYYTDYTDGFTKVSGDWKTNPSNASTGQVAGLLTYDPTLKGKIHPDAYTAKSFAPPPDVTDDEALYYKKLVTQYCPASMFTGKCRLWVQAMYGRPTKLFTHIQAGASTGRPWLKINGAVKVNDEYPLVWVDTNCGVHLDKTTGEHWFIQLSNSTGAAMPLVASSGVETLRTRLKAHYTGDPELTAQDAEHLEAFILSDCRPDTTRRQSFNFKETKPVWSLGYGWHWNWSGTAAAFVYTEAFVQSGSTEFDLKAASRSTHFRLSVTFADGKFSAASTVISGPSDWTLVPSQWCVLEPDWSTGSASKLTQPRTTLFPCEATFYAYYDRDELVTCSVTITEIDDAEDNFYDESSGWSGPFTVDQGSLYGGTVGMLDGYHKHRTAFYDKGYVAVFTCGSVTTGECYYQRAWTEEVHSITNKAMTSYPTEILYDYGPIPFTDTYPSGYPPYAYVTLYGVPDIALPPVVEFDFKSHIENISFYSYAHILVPFNDAEAITVRSESHKYTIYSQAYTGRYKSGETFGPGFQILHRPKLFIRVGNDSPTGWFAQNTGTRGEFLQQTYYARQQPLQSPAVVSPEVPDTSLVDTDETLTSVSVVLAAGATVDAVIPDRYDYKDINLINVGVHYEVRSGVQEGGDAVVVAPAIEAQTGVNHEFDNPTIVGWV